MTYISPGVALLGANDDINEASSLSYENDIVDIYSNSWGPADTGTIVDGPGHLTQMALKNGAREVIKQRTQAKLIYYFLGTRRERFHICMG